MAPRCFRPAGKHHPAMPLVSAALVLLAASILLCPTPAVAADSGKPVTRGDAMSRFVIPPRFEDTHGFSHGLAPVKQNGKWGYIDTKGEFVIPPRFDLAGPFFGELARAKENGLWGLINRQGEFVVAPRYHSLGCVAGGLVQFGVKPPPPETRLRYGYLSVAEKGRELLPAQYLEAGNFVDGRAFVRSPGDAPGVWKVIDPTGKVVAGPLPPMWNFYPQFGLCYHRGPQSFITVQDWEEAERRNTGRDLDFPIGYISSAGEIVIPPRRGVPGAMSMNGMIPYEDEQGRWGCLDERGTEIIPAQSLIPISFHNGLPLIVTGKSLEDVGKGTAQYAYILPGGGRLVAEPYTGRTVPGPHNERDIFPMRQNGKAGFITKEGKWAIPPVFYAAWEFSEGLCMVVVQADRPAEEHGKYPPGLEKGRLQGYIDISGALVIPARYHNAQRFSGGYAMVYTDVTAGTQVWNDRKGAVLQGVLMLRPPKEGLVAAQTADGWGFLPALKPE